MDNPADPTPRPIDILLVEDNESDVKLMLRTFQKAGMQNNVHVARNGSEALEFIRSNGRYEESKGPCPDLILMDVRMPVLDGVETLKALKADPLYRRIPVAMLTTSKNEHDVIRCFEYGAVGYIQKPMDFEELLNLVNHLIFYWSRLNTLPKKPR